MRGPRAAALLLFVLAIPHGGGPCAQGAPAPGGRRPERAAAEGQILIQRGRQALEIEEFDGAKQLLERAVELKPDSVEAHFLLARAHAGLKQVKPAEIHYKRALALWPGHAGSMMGLAAIAEGTGRYDEAERLYRGAIESGSTGRSRRSLASLLARTGRVAEAETILGELIAANPGDMDSRYELGLARALSGSCEAAIPELRKVVEAQPRRVPALFQLGNCLSRTGRPEEALEVLGTFRRVKREEMEREELERLVHFTMLEADRLAAAGKPAEAVAKARQAVAADPGAARAHAFLGSLLIESGDNAGALAELIEAARLDPSDAMALTEAGRLLVLAGRIPEAIEYLSRATRVDKGLPDPHRYLAILYKQMGRDEEAERHRAAFMKLAGAG